MNRSFPQLRATRRQFIAGAGAAVATARSGSTAVGAVNPQPNQGTWICTTETAPWRSRSGMRVQPAHTGPLSSDIDVRLDEPKQTIAGFGGAFSEKGWLALQQLAPPDRESVLDALFSPGQGLNFTLCRTPLGANDMARAWYSYDEVDGDFELAHFSVANDQQTLIPFIKAAMARQPDLKVWASPWSPPTWMKTNHHYAMTPAWPGQRPNGLQPNQIGNEGQDYFIQEDRYFEVYARYFRRYIEDYARQGVRIFMVMPQNEFNSAQPFPSCCWTPHGLARFLPFLGREMDKVGTQIFFGTLERPDVDMLSAVLKDPQAGPLIKGVGVQWGGKGALPFIRERHPNLPIWGSEQECGTGTNDWRYARYAWGLLKQYFLNDVSGWLYWNIVLPKDQLSGWGWPQNSLVSVDPDTRRYRFNHEFHVMKHASHFVKPGAQRLQTRSYVGFENVLAFRNPAGEIVLILQNDLSSELPVRVTLGSRQLTATLPPDSFNTLSLPPTLLNA